MPSITGRMGVILTVRDAARSASWHGELLGMVVPYDYEAHDGSTHLVCLDHSDIDLDLCLVSHAGGDGDSFSELRTGLDHLEFIVAKRDDLAEWAERLGQMSVTHSGVKVLDYTWNLMIKRP